MCRDNTPSILLCEWEVESDYLEDDRITGVMPVLFANDPKAAEAGMMDNLATARKDLDKINRAFFVPECLDYEEAAKVAKKPRLGDAEFLYKDWNLERLFETSVPTSAYTGKRWFNKVQNFEIFSLIMYIHQRIYINIQAGVTKHEPAVWLLLAQPAVR